MTISESTTAVAQWTPNNYTATLDNQGGTGSVTGVVTATYGSPLPTLGEGYLPTRRGYAFGGYYSQENGAGTRYYNADGTGNAAWDIADNATIYAKWTAKSYAFHVNANSGTYKDNSNNAYSVWNPSVAIKTGASAYWHLNAATRTGYVFKGYYDGVGDSGVQTHDASGNAVDGGYWDGSGQSAKFLGLPVAAATDFTVYAQWTVGEYQLTLDPNGGTYNGSTGAFNFTRKLKTGEGYHAEIVPSAREGYVFEGYYDADGVQTHDANGLAVGGTYWSESGAAATFKGLSDPSATSFTIYARWSPETYTLTVDPRGGTYGGSTGVYTHAAKLKTASGALNVVGVASRDAFGYLGLYDDAEGGNQVYDAEGNAVSGRYWNGSGSNATFKGVPGLADNGTFGVFAHWAEMHYLAIDVKDENGNVISNEVTVTPSVAAEYVDGNGLQYWTSQALSFTMVPDVEAKWLLKSCVVEDAGGTVRVSNTISTPLSGSVTVPINTLSYNGTMTLVYEEATYDVVYGVDAASVSASAGSAGATVPSGESTSPLPSGRTVPYGTSVTFTATANSGYAFVGWYDGSDALVSDEASYTADVTANVSLTAKFSTTVTFGLRLASNTAATLYVNGSAATNPATVTATLGSSVSYAVGVSTGYFDAWYNASTGGDLVEGMSTEGSVSVTAFGAAYYAAISATAISRTVTAHAVSYNGSTYSGLTVDSPTPFVTFSVVSQSSGLSLLSATPEEEEAPSVVTQTYNSTCYVSATAETPVVSGTTPYYFQGWSLGATDESATIASRNATIALLLNQNRDVYAIYRSTAQNVTVGVAYFTGCDSGMGRIAMSTDAAGAVQSEDGLSWTLLQGSEATITATPRNGYRFVGWYGTDGQSGTPVQSEATATVTVGAAATYYALFEEDGEDAVFEWEGSSDNKTMTWRSKTYTLPKPTNPSAVRVDTTGYQQSTNELELTVDMFSAPDVDARPEAHTTLSNIQSQTVRRLPPKRPERYMQVEVRNDAEVDAVFVGTSAGGLAV